MEDNKLIITGSRDAEQFAKKYYLPKRVTSRERYLSAVFNLLFGEKKGFPCFLSDNFFHHQDVENIEAVRSMRRIQKSDLSLVVFDSHTDMYQLSKLTVEQRQICFAQGAVNMANWILEMSRRGYDDVHLLGVSDFTRTCPELEGEEYYRFQDRIHFFLGRGFESRLDFQGEGFERTKLNPLEAFSTQKLRPFSFISLDCDVSKELEADVSAGSFRGETKLQEVLGIIRAVQARSQVIGFSVYGAVQQYGLSTSYGDREKEIAQVLGLF